MLLFISMLYTFLQVIAPPIFRVLYRLKINGRSFLPEEGPVIVVANHQSYLDPIVAGIAAGKRKMHYFAKYELFKIPVFSGLIGALNAFPVKRGVADRAAIRKSLEVLSSGQVLCMFPEGTRHRGGSIGEIMPGAALIAKKTGASIIPLYIRGTDKVMRGKIPRFPRIEASFGPPIRVGEGHDEKRDLSNQIKRSFEELAG